jgi:PEP-CTERM motif
MKSIFLACTMLLGSLAAPAFATSVTFTNNGILSGSLTSGVVSTANDLVIGGTPIEPGPFGTLSLDLGSFIGSLKHGGTLTGGNFELDSDGSVLFVTSFSGTWDKIGKGSYDLMGQFSGVSDGVGFSGVTNQMFRLSFDDDRVCLSQLNGTTTINVSTVPEPGTLTFLGTGVLGLAGALRRKVLAAART